MYTVGKLTRARKPNVLHAGMSFRMNVQISRTRLDSEKGEKMMGGGHACMQSMQLIDVASAINVVVCAA